MIHPVRRLKAFYDYLVAPELDWLQVEVSSFCNASCRYCPHAVYGKSWRHRHMTIETFEKLLPAARQAGLVHLQGWGEPLLNPAFFEMVARARAVGAGVGLTTNGLLVDRAMAMRLVEAEVDIIALSAAGLRENHDRLRPDIPFDRVLEAGRLIDRARRRSGAHPTRLHMAYLMVRSNLPDLKRLPDALGGAGFDEVIINTMDFVADESLRQEVVLPDSDASYRQVKALLDEAAARCEPQGLSLHYYLKHPSQRRPDCTEHATRSLFVGADGSVSPCVFTGLPLPPGTLPGPFPQSQVFGNASRESLADIWKKSEFADFRSALRGPQPPSVCASCPKLYMTEG